jgi:hypothetical protein
VAVPYLLYKTARAETLHARVTLGTFALMLATYVVLATHQVRWTDYNAFSSVLPMSMIALALVRRVELRFEPRGVQLARPAVLLLIVGAPLFMGIAAREETIDDEVSPATLTIVSDWGESRLHATLALADPTNEDDVGRCDVAAISAVLTDSRYFPDPVRILAHTDYGPELLYRTHHSVFSIPNHRPQPGYALMRQVFGNPDQHRASAILHENDVGAVLLCANDIGSGFFQFGANNTFVDWLARGGIPDGFELHAATNEFRIYRSTRL